MRLLRRRCLPGGRCHSPARIDFGSSGSGPVDLTRWLLAHSAGQGGRRRAAVPSVSQLTEKEPLP